MLMANQEADPAITAGEDAGREAIRLIVADDEPIFRVGVRKIVALEDDVRSVARVETAAAAVTAVGRFSADLLLLTSSICDSLAETVSAMSKWIIEDSEGALDRWSSSMRPAHCGPS